MMNATLIIRYLQALLLVSLLGPWQANAQSSLDSILSLSDTTQTLSLNEFYKIILTNHPVVKQTGLLSEMAQQEIRYARGSFDPKINSRIEHKEFEDKTYYSKLDAHLSFPTWFPVNPKVGYQRNTGELLNSEDGIPGGEQLYTGVSIPLGRGLLTDERRAAVRQAELFADITVAEQVKLINKILLDAAKDYWQWYYSYYQYRLSSQAVSIATEIFERVKINMEHGEAAMIDTVQAKIILQTRRVEQQEAWLAFQNTGIAVSNYLWDNQGDPIMLDKRIAPIMTPEDKSFLRAELLDDLVAQAKENHPELVKLSLKLDQLEVDKKLAREFLKPRLDLDYSLLSQPSAPRRIDPLNDYKIGVDLSFPILLRKERSKLALTNIKIENTRFERNYSEREIINQINSSFNEIKNTVFVLGQQEEVVDLYNRLLKSELINLQNGESDLFKINIQQEKLLQAQAKLLKLTSGLQKQKAFLYWAAGLKNQELE